MTTSLEIVFVLLNGIKIKCDYILATESKARAKSAFWFLDKKSVAYYVIGFVNQKQKVKTCANSN